MCHLESCTLSYLWSKCCHLAGGTHCPGGCHGLLQGCERVMLFHGIAWAVWHCCHWALGDSGEGGHVSLQAHVAGFVLCRLVSWIHQHPEQDRQGSWERHVKASSLLPWQMEPEGTLQPALEGNNHERDNGLFWVNRSWQPNFPWWK